MNAPPLPCLCSRRIGFYGSLQGGKWVPEEEVIAEAFDVPIPGYATKTCGNLRLWNALPVEEFNLDAFNEGNYEKVGGWLLCGWVCVWPPPPPAAQRSAAQRSAGCLASPAAKQPPPRGAVVLLLAGSISVWRSHSSLDAPAAAAAACLPPQAVELKRKADDITAVLYPNDATEYGKELRLKQQFFFVSASLQDTIARYLVRAPPPPPTPAAGSRERRWMSLGAGWGVPCVTPSLTCIRFSLPLNPASSLPLFRSPTLTCLACPTRPSSR